MEFVSLIKQASLEVQNQNKPVNVMIGTVINTIPLQIQVSQKLVLNKAQLILSRNVTEYNIEMTVSHDTEGYKKIIDATHNHGTAEFDAQTGHVHKDGAELETSNAEIRTIHKHNDVSQIYDISHSHRYLGKKVFKVHKSLKKGEKVILIQETGGQRFYVIDRVGENYDTN